MLSCECPWDGEDYERWWYTPKDYSEYKKLRATRCSACNTRIKYGDIVAEVERARDATEWEDDRGIAYFGSEIPIASHYMCEKCADVFFSLHELGFCVSPYQHRDELIKEYKEYVEYEKSIKHPKQTVNE